MFQRLPASDYGKVSPLFEPLHHEGILTAVLAGHRRGKVFVDDLDAPQAGFAWSPGVWCFLAGDPHNTPFNEGVRTALFNQGLTTDEVFIWLWVCDSDAWHRSLGVIARPRQPVAVPRLYYRCDTLKIDGRDYLPGGFTAQPINADLLARADIVLPEHVVDWIAEIGSPAEFFEYSFGFVALHGREVAAWCIADGIAGARTELGIYTQEEFRQRGLATALTALAVEHAFSLGLTEVSWQCNVDNVPSIRTAEKVGFQRQHEYAMLAFLSDEAKHAGWRAKLATAEATAVKG